MSKEKKEKKRLKKPVNKKVIIMSSIIALMIIIGIICFPMFGEKKEKENKFYAEFDPIVSKLDENIYYVFGAKQDIAFELEKQADFSYKVVDEEGNEIEVSVDEKDNKVTIKAPTSLYEEGKTYTLKVTNGVFIDEEYENAKEVVFSIVRESKQTSTIRNDLKVASEKEITVEENVLTTTNEYQENDVIVVEENEEIKAAYKIVDVNNDGTYKIDVPEINEVFSEIDYYGVEELNLSAFETNEELKEYVVEQVRASIIDSLVDTVYAKSTVEIKNPKWDEKTNKLKFGVKIEADEDMKVFDKNFLKNHKLSVELEVEMSMNLNSDITLTNYDVSLTSEITLKPKFELEHTNKNLSELQDKIKNDLLTPEYNASWLVDEYKKLPEDVALMDKTLGKISVPTQIPGLYVAFSSGVLLKIEAKTTLETSLSATTTATVGVSKNKGMYGDFKFKSSAAASLTGEVEGRVGMTTSAGFEFINIIGLRATLESGLYANGKTKITEKDDSEKGKVTTFEITGDAGLFSTYKAEANVPGSKLSFKIYDGKAPLTSYGKRYEFVNGELSKPTMAEPTSTTTTKANTTKPTTKTTTTNTTQQADKYYTVTLYVFAGCCDNINNICDDKYTFKIKAGTKLEDSPEFMSHWLVEHAYDPEWGESWGFYGYQNYLYYMNKYNATQASYDSCVSTCEAGGTEWWECHNTCSLQYNAEDIARPSKVNLNQVVNYNMEFIGETGCGATE